MKQFAYAKCNLGLQVKGILDNGYHDLDMIMLPLNFYDILEINKNDLDHDEFNCNFGGKKFKNNNSVLDAIKLMRSQYNIKDYFDITLTKKIPSQAGLGGGSSDGAATIKLLNRMYNLNLSLQQMVDIGVQVGADVPFCILNKAARVNGIGDQLKPFNNKVNCCVILVKPAMGVSTKECFAKCNVNTNPVLNDELEKALMYGQYDKACACLNNSLQPTACTLVPEIDTIINELIVNGCDGVIMSGSGSCVLGLCKSYRNAKRIAKLLKYNKRFVWITSFLK